MCSQVGSNFPVRFKEHRRDPRAQKQKFSFAQHLIDKNHDMCSIDDGLKILQVCRKGRKLDSLEEYEIYKHF